MMHWSIPVIAVAMAIVCYQSPTVLTQSASGEAASGAAASNATAGNATAGNATASNATASNTTAGNSTAGNSTAGNSTAGNSTAGNSTAGNATAGHAAAAPETASDADKAKLSQRSSPNQSLNGALNETEEDPVQLLVEVLTNITLLVNNGTFNQSVGGVGQHNETHFANGTQLSSCPSLPHLLTNLTSLVVEVIGNLTLSNTLNATDGTNETYTHLNRTLLTFFANVIAYNLTDPIFSHTALQAFLYPLNLTHTQKPTEAEVMGNFSANYTAIRDNIYQGIKAFCLHNQSHTADNVTAEPHGRRKHHPLSEDEIAGVGGLERVSDFFRNYSALVVHIAKGLETDPSKPLTDDEKKSFKAKAKVIIPSYLETVPLKLLLLAMRQVKLRVKHGRQQYKFIYRLMDGAIRILPDNLTVEQIHQTPDNASIKVTDEQRARQNETLTKIGEQVLKHFGSEGKAYFDLHVHNTTNFLNIHGSTIAKFFRRYLVEHYQLLNLLGKVSEQPVKPDVERKLDGYYDAFGEFLTEEAQKVVHRFRPLLKECKLEFARKLYGFLQENLPKLIALYQSFN